MLALSLFAAACGGEDNPAAPEGAVTTLDAVESATVQIVAEGSFVDPQDFGQYEEAGSGSGFIIDPSGLAVTNNHVVTGSALLQVFVPGESRPRNARVLGVSECSDLAVIDIDGEGYPYLQWYEGDISPGLKIYAAGYPLGDPEYTLTSGIVSKANYDIETEWASVERVIEHDARIRGGSSGGPLVTEDGHVVGINYAGSDITDQNLAVSVEEARPLVDRLREGESVTTIGVNGFGFSEGPDLSGIWVSSVRSGSPADQTGIRGGDIITRMEGVALGEDGTMSRYCDILRSRNDTDVLTVEVLRYATEEVLEGQINGKELAQVFSFARELASGEPQGSDAGGYSGYRVITDDSQVIQLEVPQEWGQVDGAPFTDDNGNRIYDVRASSNLEQFATTWNTPGVIVSASADLARSTDEASILDGFRGGLETDCTYSGRDTYSDPAYTGLFDVYTGCGGTGATYVVVAAVPPDRSFVIAVQIQANADRDFEALDRILDTFVVLGIM